jgi:hypothetical protein
MAANLPRAIKIENQKLETDEDWHRVIAEYQIRPYMWNYREADYKNNQKKMETYVEIAGLMSTDSKAVTRTYIK